MRFVQIDRIVDLQEGASITAVKVLSLAEDYLKDHFPRFPVMPGVLMLEAMFQTCAWLVRKSDDFAKPTVFLKEARNVKYANFVQPGQKLVLTANILKQDEHFTTLKAQGIVDNKVAVSARLVLQRTLLGDENQLRAVSDDYIRLEMRRIFKLLYHPPPRTPKRCLTQHPGNFRRPTRFIIEPAN